jgi:predicted O-methyltransferase YrrM
MNFTADWFSNNIPNFELCIATTPEHKLFMEIGVFEGRSTCWLLQNGLDDKGSIFCIDSFNGSLEHTGIDFKAVEDRFWSNAKEVKKMEQKVSLLKNKSYYALAEMIGHRAVFDFIYVDGSHAPSDTLSDACMAWGMLKPQGVMLFDDYQYPHEPTKVGIDAFLAGFEGQYEIILNNYQFAVKKI